MPKSKLPRDCPDSDATLAALHTIRRAERLGRRCTLDDGLATQAYAEPTAAGTVWGVNRPGLGFNILKRPQST